MKKPLRRRKKWWGAKGREKSKRIAGKKKGQITTVDKALSGTVPARSAKKGEIGGFETVKIGDPREAVPGGGRGGRGNGKGVKCHGDWV